LIDWSSILLVFKRFLQNLIPSQKISISTWQIVNKAYNAVIVIEALLQKVSKTENELDESFV
jgi:hypothetical protein